MLPTFPMSWQEEGLVKNLTKTIVERIIWPDRATYWAVEASPACWRCDPGPIDKTSATWNDSRKESGLHGVGEHLMTLHEA